MGTSAHRADAGAEGPADADDFKRIPGIGPVIERHLHEAGIRRFAQLAALSPDQIAAMVAHLPLLSAERIVRQDWAGRARALAREAELRAARPGEQAAPGGRSAAFSVELHLDPHGGVARTRALHLQDGAEEEWQGWSAERLLAFFGTHVAALGPEASGAHSAMEHTPPLGPAELLLELGELLVETDGPGGPGAPGAGADLWARLPFSLSGPAAALVAAEEPPYCVAILAADPDGGSTTLVGAAHGRLRPDRQRYEPVIELSPPREGRFQLVGILLIARAGLVRSALGPVLHVVS